MRLDVEEEDPEEVERQFYLADTEAFVEPCTVVPDIGGAPNRYFYVKSQTKWVDEFVAWLEAPHKDNKMDLGTGTEEDGTDEEAPGKDGQRNSSKK